PTSSSRSRSTLIVIDGLLGWSLACPRILRLRREEWKSAFRREMLPARDIELIGPRAADREDRGLCRIRPRRDRGGLSAWAAAWRHHLSHATALRRVDDLLHPRAGSGLRRRESLLDDSGDVRDGPGVSRLSGGDQAHPGSTRSIRRSRCRPR